MTVGLAMKFYLYSRLLVVWIWGIFVVLDAFVSRDTTKIGSMDGRNKWDFQFHFCEEEVEELHSLQTPGN